MIYSFKSLIAMKFTKNHPMILLDLYILDCQISDRVMCALLIRILTLYMLY